MGLSIEHAEGDDGASQIAILSMHVMRIRLISVIMMETNLMMMVRHDFL